MSAPTGGVEREDLVVPWYWCAGGCGCVVSTLGGYCLRCAVDHDTPASVVVPSTPTPRLRVLR